jgi:hypothetical protein
MKLYPLYLSIEDYMLPCLNKKMFGIDCPGCGIQRSLVHVVEGEFVPAFEMYPAIYTLILFGFMILLNIKYKHKYIENIIRVLAIANVVIIFGSYIIKMHFNN